MKSNQEQIKDALECLTESVNMIQFSSDHRRQGEARRRINLARLYIGELKRLTKPEAWYKRIWGKLWNR